MMMRRAHSCLMVRMKRSQTAMEPCWPMAPKICVFLSELATLVAENVLWRLPGDGDGDIERISHLRCGGPAAKAAEHHGLTREVVDDDQHPDAEWPVLPPALREPGHPETKPGWHRGQVDVPCVIRMLRGDDAF